MRELPGFSEEEAQRHSASLAEQGYDVYVGGVAAYSTLGWFSDPVLSTFIQYPEPELARIVFHELAHQVVYLKGDTMFNESFAVAVEEEGVRRWLEREGTPAQRAAYEDSRRRHGIHRAQIRYRGAAPFPTAGRPEKRAGKKRSYRRCTTNTGAQDCMGGFAGYAIVLYRWRGMRCSRRSRATELVLRFRTCLRKSRAICRFLCCRARAVQLDNRSETRFRRFPANWRQHTRFCTTPAAAAFGSKPRLASRALQRARTIDGRMSRAGCHPW